MQVKLKICKHCQRERRIFSKGLCQSCHKILNPEKYQIKKSGSSLRNTGTKNQINPISTGQKKRLAKYNSLRGEYFKTHPLCEVCLKRQSEEIHHMSGRIGDDLFRDFLAVCRPCHQWIELNPEDAKKEGYSLSRLRNREE